MRRPPEDTLVRNQIVIVPLKDAKDERIDFSDTIVMHTQLQRLEPHLKVSAIRNINDKSYLIQLWGVVVESDDIEDAVTESFIKIYLILLVVTLILGGLMSYFMLKPFRLTLDAIRSFSLQNPGVTSFPKSSVSEFKKLNRFLEEMTGKVKKDYFTLKEFSENASHELQTPIAIIQSKLEVLMDSDNLTEDQVNQISQTQNALKRLSNLSSSLGILTKIDNQEFSKFEKINLSKAVEGLMEEFRELIELKSIKLSLSVEPEVLVQSDKTLIELMLSNLVNNAIRHNVPGGFIDVSLDQKSFSIKNSGKNLSIPPEELFQRFKKPGHSNESIGLGLSIVKEVCERNKFKISYHQSNEEHLIQVSF